MSDAQSRPDPYGEGGRELDEQESSRRVITLLSDFGTDDNSVAVMKGVIFGVNPEVQIVDISHAIDPYNIEVGADVLAMAYHYFPKGTTHVAVVDPGVGGDRRSILVATENYLFVGPDNGIFSHIYEDPAYLWVRDLRAVDFFLEKVSSTFHGRDVFAPVAGYLSIGEDPEDFGPVIDDPVKLEISDCQVRPGGGIDGEVVYVDRFGNLITNIDTGAFWDGESLAGEDEGTLTPTIEIAGMTIRGLSEFYREAEKGLCGAHFNSWSRLEIFLPEGRAADELGAGRGTPVKVRFQLNRS